MAVIGTINGRVYSDTDFNANDYANRFQTLVGDIYDHVKDRYAAICNGIVTIGTGSKTFNVSNNLSSVGTVFAPGMWVYLRPGGSVQSVKNYVKNYMAGMVTAVTTNAVTVNVIVAHGSGSFGTYYMSVTGDIITTLTSPLPVAQGGTNQTTQSAARNAIGFGDPSSNMEPMFEDFCGEFTAGVDPDQLDGEQFSVRTRKNFDVGWSAVTNGFSGGLFYANYMAYVKGETYSYNVKPGNRTGVHNSHGNHPGICAMVAAVPGAYVTLMGRGGDQRDYVEFPFTGDVFEFCFMFPTGLGFNSENTGGWCMGFSIGSLTGYSILFNVGNADAVPYSVNSLPYASDLIAGGYMAASVVSYEVSTGVQNVYIDGGPQTTPFIIKEQTWYKVRMTRADTRIYTAGNQLQKTISGYTPPALGTTKGSRYLSRITKNGGLRAVTLALDYMYHRHAVTR